MFHYFFHLQVIADLEEERKCYAQESARSADFAFMLQTERDKLLQQVCLELP